MNDAGTKLYPRLYPLLPLPSNDLQGDTMNPETEKRFRVTYSIEVSAKTPKQAEALAWLQINDCNTDADVEEITPAQALVQIQMGGTDGL